MGIFSRIRDRIKSFRRIEDSKQAEEEAYREKERREMGLIDRIRSRNRVEDTEEVRRLARIENEARDRREEEEREARMRQKTEEMRNEAGGRGGSTFPPTVLFENVKNLHFWGWVFLVFLILIIAWWKNFLHFRDITLTFGYTFLGLITVLVMICFILYGYYSWLKSRRENKASFYIATALFIWMLDLAPEIKLPLISELGGVYHGFEFPFATIQGIWAIPWLSIVGSSVTFAFLYINMLYKIIKKEVTAFTLSFILIILFNYLTNQLPTYLRFSFDIPYGQFAFLLILIVLGFGAWYLDKRHRETAIPEFFSSLYMVFVFSFFWLNTGWQGNGKAWLHVLFIIGFGFEYIKPKVSTALAYLLIPSLLLIDFYGYGLSYSSDVLALQFLSPIVIVVIIFCYGIETEFKKENYAYPVAAFILLVTFILLMSVSIAGTTSPTGVPFVEKKGVDYKGLFSQVKEKFTNAIEQRLEFATGGYYRGAVEKNRYESLGVYFGNVRAADPRFYQTEPVTVWGTIRSKTYKDAVVVNFGCYRWKDSKRIKADSIIPDFKFPIFTLEEVDTECVFNPSADSSKEIPAGSNTITLSAEYNFGTDAYLKTYFIDRDRFRAYTREDVDPLKELGIKDRNPVSVSTNGPVEIGISTGEPLITVSQGYAIKPSIGITLTNRQEIQDKDKKIITRWEGRIKNITELILLTPHWITLENIESCKSKDAAEKSKCPCSMPFENYDGQRCGESCFEQVFEPCKEACMASNTKPDAQQSCLEECKTSSDKCIEECDFLFQSDGGGKDYNGYALDVSSIQFKDLNKDIDKHRSFLCRFTPEPSVLDATPITTRYFRVRARYNYLLENSVAVSVEPVPVQAIEAVPESLFKIANEIKPYNALWFPDYSPELIAAIASVESKFRHCCQDASKNKHYNCKDSGKNECQFGELITSGSSFGVMQINYKGKHKDYVDKLVKQHCNSNQNINNYECNVKVGIAILKDKFDQFKDGCSGISGITNACKTCTSDKAPYKKYSEYLGVESALRGYNGWGCGENADKGYVEKVLSAKDAIQSTQIISPTILYEINREGTGMSGESEEGPSPSIISVPTTIGQKRTACEAIAFCYQITNSKNVRPDLGCSETTPTAFLQTEEECIKVSKCVKDNANKIIANICNGNNKEKSTSDGSIIWIWPKYN